TVLVAWLWTLIAGRLPAPLHRFYARFVTYSTHLGAFILVAGGPFPGFVGAPGTYPIDPVIGAPARPPRSPTAFRRLLAFPRRSASGTRRSRAICRRRTCARATSSPPTICSGPRASRPSCA